MALAHSPHPAEAELPPRQVGRKLQRLGAVAIKNSVYALPNTDAAHEHLEWVLREIVEGGGDGSICEARFVEGLGDVQIEALFCAARNADCAELVAELRQLLKALPRRRALGAGEREALEASLARLRRHLAEVAAIDFFAATGREAVEGLMASLEARSAPAGVPSVADPPTLLRDAYQGRTWVTRKGIHVDRMASAWLIRRFIDPRARFKFVPPRGYAPEPGELRFDMFDGEFTHEGDRCTFEVLVGKMGIATPGLVAIGELVHDIDLRDGKFGRPETPGIELVIAAIALAHREDDARLERASAVFGDLFELYQRRKKEEK